jgi:hypothetical protein
MSKIKLTGHRAEMYKTLKGSLEHKLFLMWAMADNDDDADRLMQRLIDVRFERKKCEAQAILNH